MKTRLTSGTCTLVKLYVIGVAGLALVPATLSSATAQDVTPPAEAPSNMQATGGGDPKICKSLGTTGTRMARSKCLRKSQWDEIARKSYFNMEERRFQQGFDSKQ